MKRTGLNCLLVVIAALTLTLFVRSMLQKPLIEISREAWEYYHVSVYSGDSYPNQKVWNQRLLDDDLRYARQAGDLAWLDQLKRVESAFSCQAPRYNWYPACNIKLTDEPRIRGTMPLLSREEALTPDVQEALEEIIFRFSSLRYNHNPEGILTIEKAVFIDSELENSAQLVAWVRLDNGENAVPKTMVFVANNLCQGTNRWVYWNDHFSSNRDIETFPLPPNSYWPEYHAAELPLLQGKSMKFSEMEWMANLFLNE